MGLICDYHKEIDSFDGKLTLKRAYLKVETIHVGKSSTFIVAILSERGGRVMDSIKLGGVSLDFHGENYHSQCYDILKNEKFISNCDDVFE